MVNVCLIRMITGTQQIVVLPFLPHKLFWSYVSQDSHAQRPGHSFLQDLLNPHLTNTTFYLPSSTWLNYTLDRFLFEVGPIFLNRKNRLNICNTLTDFLKWNL